LLHTDFEHQGFVLLEDVLSLTQLSSLQKSVETLSIQKAGTRNLLSADWCRALAQKIKTDAQVSTFLPVNAKAVQCTYFKKSPERNWLVSPHRDQFIPVKQHINHPDWAAWTKKEGVTFVRPPIRVLREMVIVRLHLEDNTFKNGPLTVVPGSHQPVDNNSASALNRVPCLVRQGGALIMKPLLLHASAKSQKGCRRVVHFLFGPSELPNNVEWARAV